MKETYTAIGVKHNTKQRFRKAKENMIFSRQLPINANDDETENFLLDLYEQIYIAKTLKVIP